MWALVEVLSQLLQDGREQVNFTTKQNLVGDKHMVRATLAPR